MENMIIAAISAKKVISFVYGGYPRIVEPHVYGVNDGVRQLLAYQIRGGSSSGALPEWRRFKISVMQNLQVLDEAFPGRRNSPSGEHSSWDQMILVVE